MVIEATPGVQQDTPPAQWRTHHFGLSPNRWARLAGRGFWITGGGTGYGRAVAIALALAGARVFVSGRRTEKLAQTIDEAAALGADPALCHASPLDLRDEAAIIATVAAIAERCAVGGTPFHGLVHCAALPPPPLGPTPLRDLPVANWDDFMRTNVTAPWLVARHAVPLMLAGGDGARVVLFTSEAGWASTPSVGPYNVAKAAMNSLGASLAAEFAAAHPESDVQINVLIPGEARSEMNQGSDIPPHTAAAMTLSLLSHPPDGPNGRFFHRDGRHFAFAYAFPWHRRLDQPG